MGASPDDGCSGTTPGVVRHEALPGAPRSNTSQIWCNTLARLDPIACGALLAVRQDKGEISLSPGIRVALLLGGCGVLTAAGHFGDVVGIKALVTFPAVTAACVALLVATLSLQMAPGRGPVVRALVHLA